MSRVGKDGQQLDNAKTCQASTNQRSFAVLATKMGSGRSFRPVGPLWTRAPYAIQKRCKITRCVYQDSLALRSPTGQQASHFMMHLARSCEASARRAALCRS